MNKLFATGFFSGYFPKAPGTFASFLALLPIFYLKPEFDFFMFWIIIALAIGVRSSSAMETEWGKDPSKVVIDEIAGMWIGIIGHDFNNILVFVIGFILFRFFDIVKPLGINKLQDVPEGFGIMLDDVLAGIYTNISLIIIFQLI
jgi:phosphatidylglycerophosphatase A